MEPAKIKTIKELGLAAIGIAIFAAIAYYVPDDSVFKHIFGYLILVLVVGGSIWITGLWIPIFNFFKKLFK